MPPSAFSVASFGLALSFLTRLNLPARVFTKGDSGKSGQPHTDDTAMVAAMSAAVLWYPVVGLLVGMLCVVPVLGLMLLGAQGGLGGIGALSASMPSTLSWLGAWLYVLTGFVLTRGLHWDGLADITDAWGSGAQGARFWDIAKDSRLGAFGAMGQLFAFSGLLIAAQGHVAQYQWLPLIWACATGRLAAVLLAAHCSPRDPHSLGGMACAGSTKARAYGWGAIFAVSTCFLWGLGAVVLLIVLLGGLVYFLTLLAKQHQGCNGDFLGTVIVGAELCCLVALLL